jgi:hypothetical protein
MKHAVLRSIAHNVADSLASGCSLLVNCYDMDVFGEAERSPGRAIGIDFLTGLCTEGAPSPPLAAVIRLYPDALPGLCASQNASVPDFRSLRARFYSDAQGPRFDVTVEDSAGRRSVDQYLGLPGARPKTRDALGRIRTRR